LPLFGLARAIDVPMGYAGFFYGNGGVRVAGAWRLHKICGNCEIYERGMGARLRPDGLRRGKPRYTPWVCLPLCGLARGADLPQGYAGLF